MLLPYFYENTLEAGVDEVGRGCLAGPVIACAVILPATYRNPHLKDSKQLSPTEREYLQAEIKQSAISYAIGEASPQEIDTYNILQASFLAMHRAIALLSPLPAHLLIDGNRFKPYPRIKHTCIVKGDSKFMAIAAASVLAKTYRDNLMLQYAKTYQGYGWETNVGYPTKAHRKAILQLGITPLHRQSFQLLPEKGMFDIV